LQAVLEAAEILPGICRVPIKGASGEQLLAPLVELDG
jgi:hypothetical protein